MITPGDLWDNYGLVVDLVVNNMISLFMFMHLHYSSNPSPMTSQGQISMS
jgi:hypothetical protein